jgi:hypothetical protein
MPLKIQYSTAGAAVVFFFALLASTLQDLGGTILQGRFAAVECWILRGMWLKQLLGIPVA